MTKRYLKTPEEVMMALKEGKTIKTDNGYTYELIDNFIIQTFLGKIRSINTPIFFDTDYYIDEPEPLKLEVGKFYKTRDGRKAYVYAKTDTGKYNCWVVIVNSFTGGNFCCTVDGKYAAGTESGKDLVAPWEE